MVRISQLNLGAASGLAAVSALWHALTRWLAACGTSLAGGLCGSLGSLGCRGAPVLAASMLSSEGTAAQLRSSRLLLLPPSACSTGQLPPAATFPTSPGTCSESVRPTLALYSMSVVFTKRPTAANADQGASVKKGLCGSLAQPPPAEPAPRWHLLRGAMHASVMDLRQARPWFLY